MSQPTLPILRAEVVVVGGGPAGAATALTLARSGCNVALLEQSHYETARVGETLPPQIRQPLTQLGLWPRFEADCHLPSPGILSAWGRAELYENDFLFNPYGSGWHVDRRRFDAMLAQAAEEAGTVLHCGTRVKACLPQPSGGWKLEAVCNGEFRKFQAEFLVEATGRIPLLTHTEGRQRITIDRLIGVAQYRQRNTTPGTMDHRLLIEASSQGWWYSACLPHERRIVVYLTDADLIPRGAELQQFMSSQLHSASHTRHCATAETAISDWRLVAANSFRRADFTGTNHLVVGDAALGFDPLSSQGIYKGLASGIAAASAITLHRQGNQDALNSYADWMQNIFADYLKTRAAYYKQERRWPDSVFWQRRSAIEFLDG